MPVIVFGTQNRRDIVGFVGGTCQACQRLTVYGLVKDASKFTLYFVPTFTYHQRVTSICGRCGAAVELDKASRKEVLRLATTEAEANEWLARAEAERAALSGGAPSAAIAAIAASPRSLHGIYEAELARMSAAERELHDLGQRLKAERGWAPETTRQPAWSEIRAGLSPHEAGAVEFLEDVEARVNARWAGSAQAQEPSRS